MLVLDVLSRMSQRGKKKT